MKRTLVLVLLAGITACSYARNPGWAGLFLKNRNLLYGKYEMRMQITDGPSLVSCFFLACPEYFKGKDSVPAGQWREIDIEIVGIRPDSIETVVHIGDNETWWKAPYRYGHHSWPFGRLDHGYHTYGIEWTPNEIVWSLDGEPFRRAISLEDGRMHEIYYSTGTEHTELRDTIFGAGDNYVDVIKDKPLALEFSVWSYSSEWAGEWTDDNCGKRIFCSWFKQYDYTPGGGDDGSDFTLVAFDDFNTPQWDTAMWINLNPADMLRNMNGKAIAVMNCDTDDGYTGEIPDDPEDDGTWTKRVSRHMQKADAAAHLIGGKAVINMPIGCHVDAALYDMHGRIVKQILKGYAAAGNHTIDIGLAEMPTASYVLRVKGQGFSHSIPVIAYGK